MALNPVDETPTAQPGGHVCSRPSYAAGHRNCPGCRAAHAAYTRNLRRTHAYGRPTPLGLVDAGPTRDHLDFLTAAGVGRRRIAQLSGVSYSVVGRLLAHKPDRPKMQVTTATATAILAIPVSPALVDAAPIWDLVHGMVARGYTQRWISEQLGMRNGWLQLGRHQVTARHAAAVRALAEQCAIRPGPSKRARSEAARKGWTADPLWADLYQGNDQPDDQPIPFRR